MDMEEIRYLLGGTVFARAKAYTDRIQDLNCSTPMSVRKSGIWTCSTPPAGPWKTSLSLT